MAESRNVVGAVTPDQLTNPTPCTEWTVRDVINHITGGGKFFAMAVEEGSVPDDVMGQLLGGGDNLGDDYKAAYEAATEKVSVAFTQPGVLDRTVKMPFGEIPATVALNIAIFDVATHTCDIAHATGQDITDTDMLESALDIGKQLVGPGFRAPGMFDEERPCPDDAPPMQRILAFAGRAV